jgi:hypothetical protein
MQYVPLLASISEIKVLAWTSPLIPDSPTSDRC